MSPRKISLLILSGVLTAFLLQRSFKKGRNAEQRPTGRAARIEGRQHLPDEAAPAEAERQATEDAASFDTDQQTPEDAAGSESDTSADEAIRVNAESQARSDAFHDEEPPSPFIGATTREPQVQAKTAEQTVVMVADDSKVVRVKTGRLLSAYNYQVVMAEDGLDAARQIDISLPDLLITDVDMPGMGGMELVRQLRAQERTVDVPIIMITADSEALRNEALGSGVNVVLGKPYPEEHLIAEIQKLIVGQKQS